MLELIDINFNGGIINMVTEFTYPPVHTETGHFLLSP